MSDSIVMKVTASGQISLPAEVRRRWKTDRVLVIDTPDGLLIRPFDPLAIDRLAGKYAARLREAPEAGQRILRREDDEIEARHARS